jgi:ppGpp synthetase/RelA/SpoT-type nucleotidyltranferase
MIISSAIQNQFKSTEVYLEVLSKNVRDIVFNYCSKNNFAFIDRIKTLESLSEKIETGRYSKWSDLDDFYAATIIIPSLNYETEIIGFLRRMFIEVELRKRGKTKKAPDVFRFDSTRFIGKLKQVGEPTPIGNINFEIQIKTAFEHAWSVATHSMVYKTNNIDWKLLRIAAQLKSSVEQLDMIVSGSKQLHPYVTEHEWPEIKLKKQFLDSTNEFLRNENVPSELKPKDSSRLAENFYSFFYPLINNSKTPYKEINRIFKSASDKANLLGKEKFPRSISLMQYFIGISSELGDMPSNPRYVPLVTSELETIFPKSKDLETKFAI